MKEYKLEELRSSTIQYNKNPPKVMALLIWAVVLFVIAVVVWGYFSSKTEVVRNSGVITSNDKTYVMSSIQGKVATVSVEEGKKVEQGEVLLTFDKTEVEAQVATNKKQADYYNDIIQKYQTMITSLQSYDVTKAVDEVEANKNPFNAETDIYYYTTYKVALDGIASATASETQTLEESRRATALSNISTFFMYKGQYEQYYLQYISQQEYYEDLIKQYTLKATTSGYIHFENTIKEGVVVSIGTALFSISSKVTDENCFVEVFMDTSSRAFVDVGADVEVVVAGVSQSKYGTLKGKICEIANDCTLDTENGGAYYKVKIKLDSTTLTDKKGNKVVVVNGMLTETRTTYEQTTWLKWALKKIGIIDR